VLQVGIDVFSTVNVQHLESLNDQVTQLTGAVVRDWRRCLGQGCMSRRETTWRRWQSAWQALLAAPRCCLAHLPRAEAWPGSGTRCLPVFYGDCRVWTYASSPTPRCVENQVRKGLRRVGGQARRRSHRRSDPICCTAKWRVAPTAPQRWRSARAS
jgi:hypothetical protein